MKDAANFRLELDNKERNISALEADIASTRDELALIEKQRAEQKMSADAALAEIRVEIEAANQAVNDMKNTYERARNDAIDFGLSSSDGDEKDSKTEPMEIDDGLQSGEGSQSRRSTQTTHQSTRRRRQSTRLATKSRNGTTDEPDQNDKSTATSQSTTTTNAPSSLSSNNDQFVSSMTFADTSCNSAQCKEECAHDNQYLSMPPLTKTDISAHNDVEIYDGDEWPPYYSYSSGNAKHCCRNKACNRLGGGPTQEYFCRSCFTRFTKGRKFHSLDPAFIEDALLVQYCKFPSSVNLFTTY